VYCTDDSMDDPNTRTRKLVTTLINTVNQSSGADIDAVLNSLKEYEVRTLAAVGFYAYLPRVIG
jgi:hypothetical protein